MVDCVLVSRHMVDTVIPHLAVALPRVVLPAVDVDRGNLPGGLLNLGKDRADGGGLPGPRGAAEDGGEIAPIPEGRLEEDGKFLASQWWRCSGTTCARRRRGSQKRVWSLQRCGE